MERDELGLQWGATCFLCHALTALCDRRHIRRRCSEGLDLGSEKKPLDLVNQLLLLMLAHSAAMLAKKRLALDKGLRELLVYVMSLAG